ncbi:hypothetical protein OHB26_35370 [Nocardia sp. NBC_01503]|uniref:hypothetical protein n=1 Tax=Nocardia sp. NBC_01503 TaxID=2975997 RepID=UPI002E7C01A7|nr:hypothetical protein [Nocardia sp. NBC_01503]WTL32115.1 hypothetical protein OHB26_35370 [Nocardia sp. NBC_01503]
MVRAPRDRASDAAAITAASYRLLAGTPLRSASGRLTTTELSIESGVRRDVLYQHRALLDCFRARVRARHGAAEVIEELIHSREQAQRAYDTVTKAFAAECAVSARLRRMLADQLLELHRLRGITGISATTTPSTAAHMTRSQP